MRRKKCPRTAAGGIRLSMQEKSCDMCTNNTLLIYFSQPHIARSSRTLPEIAAIERESTVFCIFIGVELSVKYVLTQINIPVQPLIQLWRSFFLDDSAGAWQVGWPVAVT